jgi:hypothetical protein
MSRYRYLSVSKDAKTVKGEKRGYLTGILYLSPANEAGPEVNLCPKSTAECRYGCLYTAGMAGVFGNIIAGRLERTRQYLANPAAFYNTLALDIGRLIVEAGLRGLTPCVRLNGTSDLPKLGLILSARFPQVQFYDYTKIPRPWLRRRANYHLTFSHSGENRAECLQALKRGVNVAVVFDTRKGEVLPQEWEGYRVVDGDQSDLRFLDPVGVVVGLRAKGLAKKLESGQDKFVQIGGTV